MEATLQNKKQLFKVRSHGGFTLVEIMVVIAILGILAALIVPKVMSRPDEARRVAAHQEIGTIMQALRRSSCIAWITAGIRRRGRGCAR